MINHQRFQSLGVKDQMMKHHKRPYIQHQRNYKSLDSQAVRHKLGVDMTKNKLITDKPFSIFHERTLKQTQRLLQTGQDLQQTQKQIKSFHIRERWMRTIHVPQTQADKQDDPNKFFENFDDIVNIQFREFDSVLSSKLENKCNNNSDIIQFDVDADTRNARSRFQEISITQKVKQVIQRNDTNRISNIQQSNQTDLTYSQTTKNQFSGGNTRSISQKKQINLNTIENSFRYRPPSLKRFKQNIVIPQYLIDQKSQNFTQIQQKKDRTMDYNNKKKSINLQSVEDMNNFRYICFGKQLKQKGKENLQIN